MVFEQIRLDRTLSRFELCVLAALISILVAVFINKILFLTAVAEARSIELTLVNMRTGIMNYVAAQLIEGRYENIARAAGRNPIETIIVTPRGYVGEFETVSNENVSPGQWAYERESGSLIYYVLNRDYLDPDSGGADRISVKLVLHFDDTDADGIYNRGIDRPQGLSLVVNERVDWLL